MFEFVNNNLLNYLVDGKELIELENSEASNEQIIRTIIDSFKKENSISSLKEFNEKIGTKNEDVYETENYSKYYKKVVYFDELLNEIIKLSLKKITYKKHKEELELLKTTIVEEENGFFGGSERMDFPSDVINDCLWDYKFISEVQRKKVYENPYQQLKFLVEFLCGRMEKVLDILKEHDLELFKF